MALFKVPAPSVTGGISQQPPEMGRPDRAEDIDNFWPLPEVGTAKRPGTEHVVEVFSDPAPDILALPIDLGGDEKYLGLVSNENVTILLSNGETVPVKAVTRDADGVITGGATPDFAYLDLRRPNYLKDVTTVQDPEGFQSWSLTGTAQAATAGDGPASPLGFRDTGANPAADAFTALKINTTGAQGSWNVAALGWENRLKRYSIYVDTNVSGFSNADQVGLAFVVSGKTYGVDWDFGEDYDAVPTANQISTDGETFLTYEEDLGGGQFRLGFLYDPDKVVTTPTAGAAWGAYVRVDEGVVSSTSGIYAWGAFLEVLGIDDPSDVTPGAYAADPKTLRTVQAVATSFLGNPLIPTRIDTTSASTSLTDVYGTATFPGVGGGSDETVDVSDAAYIFVKQQGTVNSEGEWEIVVSDPTLGSATLSGSYTWPSSNPETIDAASSIASTINAHASNTDGGAGGNAAQLVLATAVGSVIKLEAKGGGGTTVSFSKVEVRDDMGDSRIISFHDEVDTLSDVPLIAQHDTRLRLTESDKTPDTVSPVQSVVRFVAEEGSGFGKGYWEEGLDYDLRDKVDASTLPHKLIRRVDDSSGTVTGTEFQVYFEWAEHDYDDRLVGDDTTSPFPSFVTPELDADEADRYVTALGFYKSRLVIGSSSQDIVMSEVSRFGNFFRTSVQTIPDSDRIDVGISTVRGTRLSDFAMGADRLYALCGESILAVTSGDTLSPRSVGLDTVHVGSVDPVPQAPSAYSGFFFTTGGRKFDAVEFGIPSRESGLLTLDSSAENPRLLDAPITRLDWCPRTRTLFALGDTGDELYGYRFLFTGQDVRQGAWFRWTFGGATIKDAVVLGCDLFLLLDRDDDLFLERLRLEREPRDGTEDWAVLLDRRVTDEDLATAASYAAGPDETTFTLPYDIETGASMTMVRRETNLFGDATVKSTGSNTIVVGGDHTGSEVYLGQLYDATFKPVRPTVRQGSSDEGAFVPVTVRQVVKRGTMAFSRSGYALVRVTDGRSNTYDISFDNEVSSGAVTLEDRELRFGVFTLPKDVNVQLINNTHKPTNLAGLEWEIELVDRGARVR